ncbi:hypothetical protein ACFV6F_06850 [Kitasatospora phosalacinea]|uniref:hypothetical protein n=1 Tax=Kitasatospora phosalacinea TaxID=2065 RepID=UPI0036566AD4
MTETPLAARPADPAAPVSVGADGRRRCRPRRTWWLPAVPAGGAPGGPSSDARFVPEPAAPAAAGSAPRPARAPAAAAATPGSAARPGRSTAAPGNSRRPVKNP